LRGGEGEENYVQDFVGETGRKTRPGLSDIIILGLKEIG
jgi:hypothetical protein